MSSLSSVALLAIGCLPLISAAQVLIVADEMPQMETLARTLKSTGGLTSSLVNPLDMPARLDDYKAVVVFIHGILQEPVEKSLINYANRGGRLVLFHHSVNSARRKNKYWLPFLGMKLPEGDLSEGGYYYAVTPVAEVVNLAPGDPITTLGVTYETRISYKSSEAGAAEKELPGFVLKDTEIYLNHTFTDGRDKKVLLGLKYREPKSGVVYMQDRGGWYKKAEKGWVVYFIFGHSAAEFEHPVFSRIACNAVSARLP